MKIKNCMDIFIRIEKNAASLLDEMAPYLDEETLEFAMSLADKKREYADKLALIKKSLEDTEFSSCIADKIDLIDFDFNYENLDKKDFFLLALKMENETLRMYEICSKNLNIDSNERKMFELLIDEEKNHLYHVIDNAQK